MISLRKYNSFEEYMASPSVNLHRAHGEEAIIEWRCSDAYKLQQSIISARKDEKVKIIVMITVTDEDNEENTEIVFKVIKSPEELTLDYAHTVYIEAVYDFFQRFQYIPAYSEFTFNTLLGRFYLSEGQKPTFEIYDPLLGKFSSDTSDSLDSLYASGIIEKFIRNDGKK